MCTLDEVENTVGETCPLQPVKNPWSFKTELRSRGREGLLLTGDTTYQEDKQCGPGFVFIKEMVNTFT